MVDQKKMQEDVRAAVTARRVGGTRAGGARVSSKLELIDSATQLMQSATRLIDLLVELVESEVEKEQ